MREGASHVPGEHDGVVPVADPEIPLVPAESIQVHLGIPVAVSVTRDRSLNSSGCFLSDKTVKCKKKNILAGWSTPRIG